jgi:hypothetical protein
MMLDALRIIPLKMRAHIDLNRKQCARLEDTLEFLRHVYV